MDFSLSQLLLVVAAAVLVLGPRQTALLAFSAGRLWNRARVTLSKFRRELEGDTAEIARDFTQTKRAVTTTVKQLKPQQEPLFTASYTPAALSSVALQQEISSLKAELERLKHSGRYHRVITSARRHTYAKRNSW